MGALDLGLCTDPSIPPTLDPATLEQDWYVGDMPLPDTKMHVENAEVCAFCVCFCSGSLPVKHRLIGWACTYVYFGV